MYKSSQSFFQTNWQDLKPLKRYVFSPIRSVQPGCWLLASAGPPSIDWIDLPANCLSDTVPHQSVPTSNPGFWSRAAADHHRVYNSEMVRCCPVAGNAVPVYFRHFSYRSIWHYKINMKLSAKYARGSEAWRLGSLEAWKLGGLKQLKSSSILASGHSGLPAFQPTSLPLT